MGFGGSAGGSLCGAAPVATGLADVPDLGLGGVALFESLHRISKRMSWETETERVDCVVTAWVSCTEKDRAHSTQTMRWELLNAQAKHHPRESQVTREQLGTLTHTPDPGAALDLAAELGGALDPPRGLLPHHLVLALPQRLAALLKRNPVRAFTLDEIHAELKASTRQQTRLVLGCFELLGAVRVDRAAEPEPTYRTTTTGRD